MTQYANTMELTDSDVVALESAVKYYLIYCQEQIAKGNTEPCRNRQRVQNLLKRVNASAVRA